MVRRSVRLISRLAILFALLWIARLWLKRWVDGPGLVSSSEPWPVLETQPAPARPAAGETQPAARLEPQPATETERASTPEPATEPIPVSRRASVADDAWVKPNGAGQAPVTHPVKAKLGSRVYRLPGMPGYEGSKPDRCYATPEEAEADGFTKAKR